MVLKNNTKKIFIIITISVIALSVLIIYLNLNQSESRVPEIGLLRIGNHSLTIQPSEEYLSYQEKSPNNKLLYCLNTEDNPKTCDWQESAKFQFEYNYTYYAYIKSLDTNLVSKPEIINYSIPDYTDHTIEDN